MIPVKARCWLWHGDRGLDLGCSEQRQVWLIALSVAAKPETASQTSLICVAVVEAFFLLELWLCCTAQRGEGKKYR